MAADMTGETPDGQEPWQLAVVLVFDHLPDLSGPPGVRAPISARLEERLSVDQPLVSPLLVYDVVEQDGQVHASVQYDQHRFRLIGRDGIAADESLNRAIQCSHWADAEKQAIAGYQAHLVCYYLGEHDSPGERLIATHRLAAALVPEGLIGIIDPEAWNCLPASRLLDITRPPTLEAFRNAMPTGLWTGFVKLFVSEHELWFCTKGMHRWGLPDFALRGENEASQQISELFFALCNYAIAAGAPLAVGDQIELGPGLRVQFEPVTGFADYLNGPAGTLIVRRLSD